MHGPSDRVKRYITSLLYVLHLDQRALAHKTKSRFKLSRLSSDLWHYKCFRHVRSGEQDSPYSTNRKQT
jgi:hypothetical protein